MKHITLFIAALSSGGAEHQITILADLLAEKSYEVELVSYSDIPDHYKVSDSVKRIRINQGNPTWKKLLGIFKYLLTQKTDYVISFGSRDNMLSLIPLLFRPSIPIIVGERCVTFNGLKWYQKLNYKLLYRRANYIVPNSYCQMKDIVEMVPAYRNKTIAITNYTDTTLYQVADAPNNETLQIGIFCRYTAQKNYERFAKVVQILKDKSKVKFHFTWYGNKKIANRPNEFYQHLEDLVKEYDIKDVITLNDHTSNVAQLIPTFDAMCLPSLVEGFSNSISEYICCGKPVICSDVADNSLMVHDGKNGFLFDPTNIDEMVDVILKFFNLSTEERNMMCIQSRKIAEELFDKEIFVQKYINLIESV